MKKAVSALSAGLFTLGLCLAIAPKAEAFKAQSNVHMVQTQTIANLNNQRSQIEQRINSSLASGQITQVQADSLRAQILQNFNLQAQYLLDRFLDVPETQSLLNALNSVENSLQSAIQTTYAASLNNPWAFPQNGFASPALGMGNPALSNPAFLASQRGRRFAPQMELQRRFAEISSQLEAGKVNGKLTRKEYTALKNELDRINRSITSFNNSNKRFNWQEQRNLMTNLENLQRKVTRDLNNNQIAWYNGRW